MNRHPRKKAPPLFVARGYLHIVILRYFVATINRNIAILKTGELKMNSGKALIWCMAGSREFGIELGLTSPFEVKPGSQPLKSGEKPQSVGSLEALQKMNGQAAANP